MRWMLITVVCVAGCGLVPEGALLPVSGNVDATPAVSADGQIRPQPRPGEVPIIDVPETDVPATENAAATPNAPPGTLGRTVASLGNVAEPGVWIKTPLVSTTQPGKVFSPKTGKTVNLTLIPIEGAATAGSRLSLSAMQGLGASLTDLIEVDVIAG